MSWTKTRSEIALAIKANPNADVTELRQRLKAERLAYFIKKTVDEAGPLEPETADRLALLLRGGAA